ncbi:hypothetical protein THF1D04_450005 [Vibrio owensii]|uniref:Uncharacterized protein n=1 Tax=Vibrio owensii TaxID=696485 RepID=A0AAU9QAR2_9VIBR|nr:hypothetical protein THF1D04_450005 [Vibrio owensii]
MLGFDYLNFENGTVHEMCVKDYDAAYRVLQRTPSRWNRVWCTISKV